MHLTLDGWLHDDVDSLSDLVQHMARLKKITAWDCEDAVLEGVAEANARTPHPGACPLLEYIYVRKLDLDEMETFLEDGTIQASTIRHIEFSDITPGANDSEARTEQLASHYLLNMSAKRRSWLPMWVDGDDEKV